MEDLAAIAANNNHSAASPPDTLAEEGDQAVLHGLLSGLLGAWPDGTEPDALTPEILEPEEERAAEAVAEYPALDSSSNLTDFIEGLRCLLETHSARRPLQLPGSTLASNLLEAPAPDTEAVEEAVLEKPENPNDEFQEVADGLLAELLGRTDAGLLSDREPLPVPATALSLLGLATSFGDLDSPLDDEFPSGTPTSHRPAGPFEALLDAIDSELGPRPQFRAAHAMPEAVPGERFVTFELADDWYALPLERVLETDRLARCAFVPGMPPYFLGVINLRGEILPLVDLRTLFGFDDAPFEGRMLVIEDPSSKQRFAFRVDRLAGIVSIPAEDIGQPLLPEMDDEEDVDLEDEEAPEPAVASRVAPLLRGVAFPGTQSVHILDTAKLLAVATGEATLEPGRTESKCRS